MHMFIHIRKDNPTNKDNTRRSPKASKDLQGWPKKHPRDTQGTPKASKHQQGSPKDAKRVPKRCEGTAKGRPKDAQSQPKARKRPSQGTLGITSGPQGNRNAKTLNNKKIVRRRFWRTFWVRCTCNPRTPVQSKRLK